MLPFFPEFSASSCEAKPAQDLPPSRRKILRCAARPQNDKRKKGVMSWHLQDDAKKNGILRRLKDEPLSKLVILWRPKGEHRISRLFGTQILRSRFASRRMTET